MRTAVLRLHQRMSNASNPLRSRSWRRHRLPFGVSHLASHRLPSQASRSFTAANCFQVYDTSTKRASICHDTLLDLRTSHVLSAYHFQGLAINQASSHHSCVLSACFEKRCSTSIRAPMKASESVGARLLPLTVSLNSLYKQA